ncbi:MAG: 16S rRNA (adenine(1518)-N(6)/adenine(1519)-N(6))-dimethyltransferase RsmA [Pseudomonadota bacterium]
MPRPRKRFGQNFLTDRGVIADIVSAIDPRPGDRIVEIGPGRGALTEPLLEHDIQLTVVEIDRDLAANWQQRAATNERLKVVNADALNLSDRDLYDDDASFRLVGNLPYNISTPLLFRFLDWSSRLSDLHLMLQNEVVDRMAAGPGSKTYGRLTVMLSPHFEVESLFTVPGSAFYPPPKVESAVARLTPHATPPFDTGPADTWRDVVAASFSLRRKTLRNALRTLMDEQAIAAAGVDPSARAETLAPEAFAALSRALVQQRAAD